MQSVLPSNPYLPKRSENLGLPDPLASDAKPISTSLLSTPKRFHLDQWLNGLNSTVQPYNDKKIQLTEASENLLNQFLSPMHKELKECTDQASEEINYMRVTEDPLYQIAQTEAVMQKLQQDSSDLINKAIKSALDAFDNNQEFRENFKKGENIASDSAARERLASRLKHEQDRVNQQKNSEKELIGALQERMFINARIHYAQKIQSSSADKDMHVQAGGNLLYVPKNISFVPGKEKFHLLTARFSGVWNGTIYSVQDGVHRFNPQDPACRRAFVDFARAQSDGTTKVSIKLGGGTSNDFGLYGNQNPDNSDVLHKIAMYFMATLLHGFDEIPPKGHDYDTVKKYYAKNNKLPAVFADVDLTVPPLAEVDIENFTPKPEDRDEFERWKGIRKAIIECRMEENEKLMKEDPDQATTLKNIFENELANLERLGVPDETKVNIAPKA